MAKTQVMSAERMRRTLSRLAHEVIERNRGAATLEIVGIRRRGYAVAEALAAEIEQVEPEVSLVVHALDVTPYRDDLDDDVEVADTSDVQSDLTDRDVILVDDVLFTGRTARAALDAVIQYGRPRSIQLVILIDRGHREYPIQPDYVGRAIPTKHRERVAVAADAEFAVYIEE